MYPFFSSKPQSSYTFSKKTKKNLERTNISWKMLLGRFMQKTKGEELMHASR